MAEKRTREWLGDEPSGVHQVWHKEGDGYRHVLDANVGNLLAALVLPDLKADGQERAGITERTEERRATTFGDVIVNPAGQAYRLDGTEHGAAFQPIPFAPTTDIQRLFAEQREEVLAAVADGLRAGGLFKEIMREAGVYGVKPEEVADIRKEVERETERER
jgi:hypothetical protein